MARHKTLTTVVGTALAASLAAAPAAMAESNPFAASSLDKGYMVADAQGKNASKTAEGKCGEGKCGGMKTDAKSDAKASGKTMEGKCGEGKCGGKKPDGKASK